MAKRFNELTSQGRRSSRRAFPAVLLSLGVGALLACKSAPSSESSASGAAQPQAATAQPLSLLNVSYDPTRLRGTRARLVGTSRGIYYAFNGEYRPGVAALALASADALPLDDDGNFAISIYFEPLDGASGIAPIGLDVLVDEQPAETR